MQIKISLTLKNKLQMKNFQMINWYFVVTRIINKLNHGINLLPQFDL